MSDERGSATVLVLAAVGLVLAAGALVTAIASAVNARHQGAVAADAAALAAASRASAGPEAACALAARVARADGVRLRACVINAAVASVAVQAVVRIPWWGQGGVVQLDARAGPCPNSPAQTNRDKATPVVRPS